MMLHLYNTLNRKKIEFVPRDEEHVRVYVCGPTVYDHIHVGNARPIIVFDVLYRLLQHLYPRVTYVRNITDIDDKIIVRAAERGEEIGALTERTIRQFHHDIEALGTLKPDIEPRATDHIHDMIKMINLLLIQGFAYSAEQHVLFHVPALQDYGRLSRRDRDDMVAGARVEVAPYKKDPADFVLWKPSMDDQVGWNSPWGRGRPGWHIECSAMSSQYLGEHFDIHCGGVDNMFPHHENEIAQSVCLTEKPFVNIWLHSEHLMVEGGKMSKSLGNFYRISDLKDMGFSAENIRYQLLSGHYRNKINFSSAKKYDGDKVLQRLSDFKDRVTEEKLISDNSSNLPDEFHQFCIAMDDDLDTPRAIAVYFNWIRDINKKMDHGIESPELLSSARNFIDAFDKIFGFLPQTESIPSDIMSLAERRQEARDMGDWPVADGLRIEIEKRACIVEDTSKGPKLKKA